MTPEEMAMIPYGGAASTNPFAYQPSAYGGMPGMGQQSGSGMPLGGQAPLAGATQWWQQQAGKGGYGPVQAQGPAGNPQDVLQRRLAMLMGGGAAQGQQAASAVYGPGGQPATGGAQPATGQHPYFAQRAQQQQAAAEMAATRARNPTLPSWALGGNTGNEKQAVRENLRQQYERSQADPYGLKAMYGGGGAPWLNPREPKRDF